MDSESDSGYVSDTETNSKPVQIKAEVVERPIAPLPRRAQHSQTATTTVVKAFKASALPPTPPTKTPKPTDLMQQLIANLSPGADTQHTITTFLITINRTLEEDLHQVQN